MLFFSNFKFCSVKKKTWQYQMTENWQTTEKQNWTATAKFSDHKIEDGIEDWNGKLIMTEVFSGCFLPRLPSY